MQIHNTVVVQLYRCCISDQDATNEAYYVTDQVKTTPFINGVGAVYKRRFLVCLHMARPPKRAVYKRPKLFAPFVHNASRVKFIHRKRC